MARIDRYRDGKFRGSLELGQRTYLVGRDPEADLVLHDPLASRRHIQISWEGREGFVLTDLDTPNGTIVDGVREFKKPLWRSATIQVGGELLLFCPDDDFEPPDVDDTLPAWAMMSLDDPLSDQPSTGMIPPVELRELQAKARDRTRPHLLWRIDKRKSDVFPLDLDTTEVGYGPVRGSLGESSNGKAQVLAEFRREGDKCRVRAKGLFAKIELNGNKRVREALLGEGDYVRIDGSLLEFRTGLKSPKDA